MRIAVQEEDFDVDAEIRRLRSLNRETGAVATFTGLVREMQDGAGIQALELEHYPGMTQRSLEDIAEQATQRWSLIDITVIHRVGCLAVTDQIVLVAVSSAHRQAAFDACQFIMDYLKTRAPFWKKVHYSDSSAWVESKTSDEAASRRWELN